MLFAKAKKSDPFFGNFWALLLLHTFGIAKNCCPVGAIIKFPYFGPHWFGFGVKLEVHVRHLSDATLLLLSEQRKLFGLSSWTRQGGP